MTPLPETLGTDLNEIKTLIEERLLARQSKMQAISEAYKEVEAIDHEVNKLRDHASIILGTKADRSEGKTPRGEQEKKNKEKDKETTEKTP